jgi:hypothetical protein
MQPLDPVVRRELPWVRKILDDEAWLAGERRHRPVDPDDPEVVERVCDILLTHGARMRSEAEHALARG